MRVLPSSGLAFFEISRFIPLMPRLDVCALGTHQEGLWHAERRTNRAPSAQNRSHHLNGHSDGEQTRGSRVCCSNVRWTILSRTGRHRNRDVNPSLAWETPGGGGQMGPPTGRQAGTGGRGYYPMARSEDSAQHSLPGLRAPRALAQAVGLLNGLRKETRAAVPEALDPPVSQADEACTAGRRPVVDRECFAGCP